MQRPASEAARASPPVRRLGRRRVGVLFVVDHDPVVAFAPRVAPQQPRLAQPAVVHLVEKGVMEILSRIHARTSLEQQHAHPGARQLHGGPPAARARADDDGVVTDHVMFIEMLKVLRVLQVLRVLVLKVLTKLRCRGQRCEHLQHPTPAPSAPPALSTSTVSTPAPSAPLAPQCPIPACVPHARTQGSWR